MEISVIIPIYNKESYIENCAKSLLAQDFDDYEIIIVDDGSNDKSGEILDSIANTDSKIKIYHTPNQGVTAARKFGYDHSSGRYIMFVDADDELLPDAMRHMYKEIETTNADEVIAPYKNQYGITKNNNPKGWQDSTELMIKLLSVKFTFCVLWSIIFKRELLTDVLSSPREIVSGEDILMQIGCLAKYPKVYFTDKAAYKYTEGLPNERKLDFKVEILYDKVLENFLKPLWNEMKYYFVLHQIKIYENFIDRKQFYVYKEYYHKIDIKDNHHINFFDRLVMLMPPYIAYIPIHIYKKLIN